ncbi:HEPN domain-containing protein [Candidatus Parabeggiatoa sp. HSG14]|uniref:HEPN domain-containing protein n=1 Tax=Candidatus Parabeggiatoa sp. HSG14 TaxID=3055593 RepID=UPI0025A78D6F|nr:HEPN domain-containing protein [Thiotrichales bacterium HSG14]
MPTRNELKELAKLRLKEAETLFNADLYDGAVYVSGYVIEFALKARICKLLDINEYPSSGKLKSAYAVHNFEQLLLLSGLQKKISLAHAELHTNWSIIIPWSPEMRYQSKGTISKSKAEEILNAVRDEPNGVLKWIMKYW